jgi:hypothetical protein
MSEILSERAVNERREAIPSWHGLKQLCDSHEALRAESNSHRLQASDRLYVINQQNETMIALRRERDALAKEAEDLRHAIEIRKAHLAGLRSDLHKILQEDWGSGGSSKSYDNYVIERIGHTLKEPTP